MLLILPSAGAEEVRHLLERYPLWPRPCSILSERWDIVLRLIERFGRECAVHVPFVTTHRGQSSAAAAELIAAGRHAVAAHLARSGVPAEVACAPNGQHLVVQYALPDPLPLVTAIVATRDRVELLRGCLAGLLHRTDYSRLEIIVIDNGSEESATKRYLETLSSESRARIISSPGPFNFSELHNRVVPAARGAILAFVNNDVDVVGSDWLSAMVAHAVRPSVGIVGAKLLYPTDRIQHAGVVIGLSGGADHVFRGLRGTDPGPYCLLEIAQNVAAVTGACVVLRRAIYEEVGGMDTAFAVGFNDVDLCLRIRERGYEVVWTPAAELVHMESMSRGREEGTSERELHEIALLKSRWKSWIAHDPYYNPNLSLQGPLRGLAFPPRTCLPWLEAKRSKDQPSR